MGDTILGFGNPQGWPIKNYLTCPRQKPLQKEISVE